MTRQIYLAGPMTGLTPEEADAWRRYVTEALWPDIRTFSPLRGSPWLKDVNKIPKQTLEPSATSKAIITRDRFDVMNADLVLFNFMGAKEISIGTVVEVGWADSFRKPAVFVMEPGNVHEHPMLDEVAAWRTDDLDQAITYAKEILLPDDPLVGVNYVDASITGETIYPKKG